jgi:DNA topoisomerase-1
MPDKEPHIVAPCPECAGTLVVKTNRKTGERFLACDRYPVCRYTRELTEYLKLKEAGYEPLF